MASIQKCSVQMFLPKSNSSIKCETRASRQMCPSLLQGQYCWGCHLPLLHKWRARGWLWLTTCFVAAEDAVGRKRASIQSTSHKSWLLIRFVFTAAVSPLLNQSCCSGRAVCECQALQLNNQQIGSGCLSHADAHYKFSSAHWQSNRLERWEEDERPAPDEMPAWYGEEQMLSLLLVCLCGEDSVSNLHNEKRLSLLWCVPVVASSRSLFTNAFLFSSRSWLGIRPALPPSMWQAYVGKTHKHTEEKKCMIKFLRTEICRVGY